MTTITVVIDGVVTIVRAKDLAAAKAKARAIAAANR